ncbi:hypothetical protein [Phenylobacterium sp.]|uniref:hypothetical protein n=1 Tax=Phenylobacterium sp. TaxID=1871053 RepID=UPI0035678BB4
MQDEPHPTPETLAFVRSPKPPLVGNAPAVSYVYHSDVLGQCVCYVPRMGLAPHLARPLPTVAVDRSVEQVLAIHDLNDLLGTMRLVAQGEIPADAPYVIPRRLPLAAFETRVRHPRTGAPVAVFFFVELDGMIRRVTSCQVVPIVPPTGGSRATGNGGGGGGGGGIFAANDEGAPTGLHVDPMVAKAPASLDVARITAERRRLRRLIAERAERMALDASAISAPPPPADVAATRAGSSVEHAIASGDRAGDNLAKPRSGRRTVAQRPDVAARGCVEPPFEHGMWTGVGKRISGSTRFGEARAAIFTAWSVLPDGPTFDDAGAETCGLDLGGPVFLVQLFAHNRHLHVGSAGRGLAPHDGWAGVGVAKVFVAMRFKGLNVAALLVRHLLLGEHLRCSTLAETCDWTLAGPAHAFDHVCHTRADGVGPSRQRLVTGAPLNLGSCLGRETRSFDFAPMALAAMEWVLASRIAGQSLVRPATVWGQRLLTCGSSGPLAFTGDAWGHLEDDSIKTFGPAAAVSGPLPAAVTALEGPQWSPPLPG